MKQFFFFLLCAFLMLFCLPHKCQAKKLLSLPVFCSSYMVLSSPYMVLSSPYMALPVLGDDDNDNTDANEGSSDGDAQDLDENPSRQQIYKSEAHITLTPQKKNEWVRHIDKEEPNVDKTIDLLKLKSSQKEDWKTKYTSHKDAVKGLDFDILHTIKDRVDKNGDRMTTNNQQNLARLTGMFDTIMSSVPKMAEQMGKGDRWGAAASALTMLSGMMAVIPTPQTILASSLFAMIGFFINIGNMPRRTMKAAHPFKQIFDKIDQAVKDIEEHERKLMLSRFLAPLELTQRISETFLRRGTKPFTQEEYMFWALSNNFPPMHSFIDALSEIKNYVHIMMDKLREDNSVKPLIIAYTQISMLRDLLLADVANLLPDQTPAIIEKVKSLRDEYLFSLNRGKESSYKFLEMFHRPTPKLVWSIGWYYPTTQSDKDVIMLNTYLNGLSYTDDEDTVKVLPPAMIDAEILRLIKCKIITNITKEGVKSYLTVQDAQWGGAKEGYVIYSTRPGNNQKFSFIPTEEGYTKISVLPNSNSNALKRLTGTRIITLIGDKNGVRKSPMLLLNRNPTHGQGLPLDFVRKDEFVIIPENTKRENEAVDVLFVMLGIKGDTGRFLMKYGGFMTFTSKKEEEDYDKRQKKTFKGFSLAEAKAQNETHGYWDYPRNPVILQLKVENFQDVKSGIQSKYTDMAEVVDVGKTMYQINENIHFCRLLGKCKLAK